MDIRTLSPDVAVSPQIEASDLPKLAQAGFTTIVCNRPDAEVPPSHQAAAIEAAATAEGLAFHYIPVTHQGMTPELIEQEKQLFSAATGPVFAYCASGTRSAIVWSYAMAGQMPTDDIISATAASGYDLGGMRDTLDKLAQRSG